MKRNFLIVLALLALLVVLASCSPQGEAPQATTLEILYTGNVNGELERCGCSEKQLGGLARRKTVIDQYRSDSSLLLDVGDLFFGSFQGLVGNRDFYSQKSSAMIRSMNHMGYDAGMIGDYDFAEGKDFLVETAKGANFPFVCSNLVGPQGEPVFTPFTVSSKQGLRIAIVGFLDSNVVTEPYRRALKDLRIEDPFEVAKRILPDLEKKSDLIVALLHFNLVDIEKFLTANPRIQLAILGHTIGDGKIKEVGKTLTVSGGRLGKELGRIRLTLDTRRRITSHQATLIPIPEETGEDSTVKHEVDLFNRTVEEKRFSDDVRYRSVQGTLSTFVGSTACMNCHPLFHQQWSNTPHAFAFETLVEKGYAFNPECVYCHVVGYGAPTGYISPEKTPHLAGVQCESCHGAGKEHLEGKPMESGVPEEVCVRCHDDVHSPPFEYSVYSALSNQCSLP
jgi:hypothetical protein